MSENDFGCYQPGEDGFSYDKLDPGIRDVVRWLHECGFTTTDSGDGKHKVLAGWTEEEIVPFPHVYIQIDPKDLINECHDLVWCLWNDHQMRIKAVAQTEAWLDVTDAQFGKPYIEARYDPVEDLALIGLFNVTSDMVRPALERKLAAKVPNNG